MMNSFRLSVIAAALLTAVSACLNVSAEEKQPAAPLQYNSVVRFTLQQKNRPIQVIDCPWLTHNYYESSGAGFVIDGHRILTCAHVLENTTNVMVRKLSSDTLFPVQVLHVCDDSDLALVTVADKSFFSDTQALAIKDLPDLKAPVQVAGYPMGVTNLCLTNAMATGIRLTRYTHCKKARPVICLDSYLVPGFSGGPVFAGDLTVAGVAFQTEREEKKTTHVIPGPVIRQFLADAGDGTLAGAPDWPFDVLAPLENPDMRKSFKLGAGQTGVLVCSAREGVLSKLFRKDDVLLALDGNLISNTGEILQRGLNLDASMLFAEKQVNEKVVFDVLRRGKPIKVEYTLQRLPPLAIQCLDLGCDNTPAYFITGGLLFTALSWDYVKLVGRENLVLASGGTVMTDGDRRVMLCHVLPDEINEGYQQIKDIQVVEVNGRTVKKVRELKDIVDRQKSGFITFLLANKMPVILDVGKMKAATPSILELYEIPAERSTNLK